MAGIHSENYIDENLDIIVIGPHKIKYMNPKFKKVKAKMYDYLCDIKLRVENANFKAHREVLSEASDYFSAMFSHDMLEKEQDVIELKGISPGGFSVILDYFYHGHVTVITDTAEDILEAARFFQVDWLVEVCSHYFVHQLSIDNYQSVLHLADKYWLGDLRGDIFHFLGLNIKELSKEKDFFLNFDLELLTQFLSAENKIFIDAEEEFVLDLVNKWVSADKDRRQDYFLPLLRLIRFPLMELESLKTLPASVLESPEIQDFVEEAKFFHNNIPQQSLFKGERFVQRGAQPNVVMFYLSLDYSTLVYRNIYTDSRCQEELAFTGTETQFESSTITTLGNYLYRSGGYNLDMCSSDSFFRFDPHFRDWTQLASMRQPRVSHSMCASERHLFVLGGVHHFMGDQGDEDAILSSVEVCDVSENIWRELPCFPTGVHNHACVYHDDCLYVSGGISDDPYDSVPMQKLVCLSLNSRTWDHKSEMLYQRQSHSMSVCNDRFYVFGGYTALATDRRFDEPFSEIYACEMYDIGTNQWTEISSIPETFGHIQKFVGLWDGQFFFFGGGHLHSYNVDEDRMQYGDYFGGSVQKIACLRVAYPRT